MFYSEVMICYDMNSQQDKKEVNGGLRKIHLHGEEFCREN